MNDKTATIQQLKDLVEEFRRTRNWGKYHSSKNLAVSIAIEAAELMEHFQWDDYPSPPRALGATTGSAPAEQATENFLGRKSLELHREEGIGGLRDELADIIIYCLYFAASNGIDVSKAVEGKMRKNSKKYPVRIFRKGDGLKDYWRIKKEYRMRRA